MSLETECRKLRHALYLAAPHCQGSSEAPNKTIALALDTAFPIRLETLAQSASRDGFHLRELWPWWFRMSPEGAQLCEARARLRLKWDFSELRDGEIGKLRCGDLVAWARDCDGDFSSWGVNRVSQTAPDCRTSLIEGEPVTGHEPYHYDVAIKSAEKALVMVMIWEAL